MRILVTGGTGHLGQAIMSGLKREGHQVRILARQPRSNSEVEWIKGDLATGDGVREAVVDVDAIIHAATNRRRPGVVVSSLATSCAPPQMSTSTERARC